METKSNMRHDLESKLRRGEDLFADIDENRRTYWQKRIDDVIECPDNKDIPRDPQAGSIVEGNIVMHNGILIDPLSYYGYLFAKMLMKNKGVHEPQEEKVFQEVLASLAGGEKTMLEFGSYWAFYSLWFLKHFPLAHCFMVEPFSANLDWGKWNFNLNNKKGVFTQAFIGAMTNEEKNIISPDSFCLEHGIEFVDILHADIQRNELEMLRGSRRLLAEKRIGFMFISSHSNLLHYACRDFLKDEYGFSIVTSADCMETYSVDGILVMKAPGYGGVDSVSISKKP